MVSHNCIDFVGMKAQEHFLGHLTYLINLRKAGFQFRPHHEGFCTHDPSVKHKLQHLRISYTIRGCYLSFPLSLDLVILIQVSISAQ